MCYYFLYKIIELYFDLFLNLNFLGNLHKKKKIPHRMKNNLLILFYLINSHLIHNKFLFGFVN